MAGAPRRHLSSRVHDVADGNNVLKVPRTAGPPAVAPAMTPSPDRHNHISVLGVPISLVSPERASAAIHHWAKDESGRVVFVRDIFGIMQTTDEPDLRQAHEDADMVTPGGRLLARLARRADKAVSRTNGLDLMECVFRSSEHSGLKHFFYGGRDGVARKLRDQCWRRFHRLQVAGFDTLPAEPLAPGTIAAAAVAINASGADIVWIGLPTPQQEFLMRELRPLVHATLIGVGGAFDVYAGAVRRAPRWMRDSVLERFWPLASNPRRFVQRYALDTPRFLLRLALSAAGAKG